MSTRRAFLRGLAGGAGVLASFRAQGLEPLLAAGRAAAGRTPICFWFSNTDLMLTHTG